MWFKFARSVDRIDSKEIFAIRVERNEISREKWDSGHDWNGRTGPIVEFDSASESNGGRRDPSHENDRKESDEGTN